MTRTRISTQGDKTRAAILQTGLALWRQDPARVTLRNVGLVLGITHSACHWHWGSVEGMRNAIAEYAVRCRDPIVVPLLIIARHPAAEAVTPMERMAYMAEAGRACTTPTA